MHIIIQHFISELLKLCLPNLGVDQEVFRLQQKAVDRGPRRLWLRQVSDEMEVKVAYEARNQFGHFQHCNVAADAGARSQSELRAEQDA